MIYPEFPDHIFGVNAGVVEGENLVRYIFERLKPFLKLTENPDPTPTRPRPPTPTPGTNFFSAKSCLIFIKLTGYLLIHLPT